MAMDPQAQDAAPAQEQPAQDSASPEMMDPESEAEAAAALVSVFALLPDCVAFSAKQNEDGSASLSCEMGDGSKVDYAVSVEAIDAAIAEMAGED